MPLLDHRGVALQTQQRRVEENDGAVVVLGIEGRPEPTRSAGQMARILKSEAKVLKERDSSGAGAGASLLLRQVTAPVSFSGRSAFVARW
ncbi:hypothetical protein [Streptomyces sp. NPDC058457]|uniref:hypothetical protein n=1 Tax=Streptomyces sp. NPDC058457 TaxID=3346507 RepID=UPI003655090D